MTNATGEAGVFAALERLRAQTTKLRARDVTELVDTFANVFALWRDRDSRVRRRAERELPAATGFSAEVIREGLSRALAAWDRQAVRTLVEAELRRADGTYRSGFETTSVLLAGSIPMPTLSAIAFPLLLRSPVLTRPSRRDPLTASLFVESLREVDEALASCVEIARFDSSEAAALRAFAASPCVVAYGSDETVAALKQVASTARRFVAYGHRLSIAVLGEAACSASAVAATAGDVALDVALFDQLGCLSPAAVYVVGAQEDALRFGRALADALDSLAARLPIGRVDVATRGEIAHARSDAELRAASDSAVAIRSGDGFAHTVIVEAGSRWRPTPLHRFVRVYAVASADDLDRAIAPLARHLSTAAVAGFGRGRGGVEARLRAAGASRICVPGQMQSPPLDWQHDGLPPLEPLACDP